MADEGEYELKEDGDTAEVRGASGDGWGNGPKPGDPDFVPPKVVIEAAPKAREERAVEAVEEPPATAPLEVAEEGDVHQHKAVAILGYVFFAIPLVAAPHSRFARFHANQGLLCFILWITAVVGCVVCWGLNLLVHTVLASITILVLFFGCMLTVLQPVLLLGTMAMVLMGIVNAANGEMKPLPVIGGWRILKNAPEKAEETTQEKVQS